MPLILASASPRRKELLSAAGIEFDVRPVDVDETILVGERADDYVLRVAENKARASWQRGELSLGADTVVVVDSQILGKPVDAVDAKRMLALLSSRSHTVVTGIALFDGAAANCSAVETEVYFRALSAAEIDEYVASGEPFDKAGAYGIQGLASKFVERIDGCYFNVVGLPVSTVYGMLGLNLDG